MSNLNSLIDAIVDGDTLSIQDTFNAEMSERISSVLDVYKTELSKSVFNPQLEQEETEE